jgi:hypothetical protein
MSNPRFGESLIEQLINGARPSYPAESRGSVADFLSEAVTIVIDWVAGGVQRSGQVCVTTGAFPTWVRIEKYEDRDSGEDTYKFFASTNDGCLFVGIAPTLCVSDTDPGVVATKAMEYLTEKFGALDAVDVRVFRTERSTQEPVLEGTSADGTFEERPDSPSL